MPLHSRYLTGVSFGALALVAALAGCRTAQAGSDATAKRLIDKVMDSYSQAYQNNDPNAIAELYTQGAMLMPPGHELVEGRDSVRAFWSRGMEPGFKMTTMTVEVSGTTAYVVGRYYVPPDGDDDAETGKYLIALRREADGVWRITADIWNADDSDDEPDAANDSTSQSVALLD
jgi:uncharacterized protein (TIGR02246 family)